MHAKTKRQNATWTALLALVVLSVACVGPSAEDRIRTQFDEMERLAQERDVSALLEYTSDRYTDNHGNDRSALRSLLRYRLRPGRSIHVLKKIREVEVDRPGFANVDLLVALADAPMDDWPLDDLDGDVMRIEIKLEEDDSERWQIVRAQWRRAGPADLF